MKYLSYRCLELPKLRTMWVRIASPTLWQIKKNRLSGFLITLYSMYFNVSTVNLKENKIKLEIQAISYICCL